MTEQKIQKSLSEWQSKNAPKTYQDEYYYDSRLKQFFSIFKKWKKYKQDSK